MEKEKKKISKAQKRAIIVASISVVLAIVLIIINVFIPVKYLGSYLVSGNKRAEEGVMRVRFVDVGYGDCTIIELPDGKNMLIDGGNGTSSNVSRILKFLNQSGIQTLDYLICSSVNAEHCGGLYEIINYKNVNKIYMPYSPNVYLNSEYNNFNLMAHSCGAELVNSCYGAGESNEEYGYFFKILSPSPISYPDGEYENLKSNPDSVSARNAVSAVIWLEYAGTSFLFTSDATDGVLTNICNSYAVASSDYPVKLEACNILQVANHGNESSACALLYDAVQPDTAVISVGENGNGCPSLNAISNAVNYVGNELYRTDVHGTITIQVNRDGYTVI